VEADRFRQDVSVRIPGRNDPATLAAWLPERIFDAHIHNFLREHVDEVPRSMESHIINTYPESSLQDTAVMHSTFFPGREVKGLHFSHAMPGVAFKKVNDWLQQSLPPSDRFALFGLQQDIPYTLERLDLKPAALKQYYLLSSRPAVGIYDVFPAEVLDRCQELEIPIILHLPRPIVESVEDVCDVATAFPRLPIVLAHAGIALTYTSTLTSAYEELASFENVYFDTALVDDPLVMKALLGVIGSRRVCYGSDSPLNAICATTYVHPELGPRMAPATRYSWTDATEYAEFGHLGVDSIQWHWAAMNAVFEGIHALPPKSQDRAIDDIFTAVAMRLYG
jgi:hypothetical protein